LAQGRSQRRSDLPRNRKAKSGGSASCLHAVAQLRFDYYGAFPRRMNELGYVEEGI
jgi:hypothetical protein